MPDEPRLCVCGSTAQAVVNPRSGLVRVVCLRCHARGPAVPHCGDRSVVAAVRGWNRMTTRFVER